MENTHEVRLPIELSKLSVEEIGTIFLIMVMPYLDDESKLRWATDSTFIRTILDLKQEEIVTISNDGVDIDLTWI